MAVCGAVSLSFAESVGCTGDDCTFGILIAVLCDRISQKFQKFFFDIDF